MIVKKNDILNKRIIMPIIPSYTSSRKYRLSVDYDAIQARAIQSAMLVSTSFGSGIQNHHPNNKRRRSQDLAGSFKAYLQTTFSMARKKRSPSLPSICYLTQICKFLLYFSHFFLLLSPNQIQFKILNNEILFIQFWF